MSVDLHALDTFLTILNKAEIAIYYNKFTDPVLTNLSNFFNLFPAWNINPESITSVTINTKLEVLENIKNCKNEVQYWISTV